MQSRLFVLLLLLKIQFIFTLTLLHINLLWSGIKQIP